MFSVLLKPATALLFILILQSNIALALSLGEINLDSHLNQQLNATIEINNPTAYPVEQIVVKHATLNEYRKFEIERNAYINSILITVSIENGNTFVHLRSKRLMRELILSFVLTLDWPEGHFSKEYTLLLDPHPDITPQNITESLNKNNLQAQQIEADGNLITATPLPVMLQASTAAETSEIALTEGRSISSDKIQRNRYIEQVTSIEDYRPDVQLNLDRHAIISEYGPVAYGESITMIAMKIRPNDSYSVQKITKLLYQLNKKSFMDGNINMLESGEILEIPDLSSIYLKKHRHLTTAEREQIKSNKLIDNSAAETNIAAENVTETRSEEPTTPSAKNQTMTAQPRFRILDKHDEENTTSSTAGVTEKPLKTNAEILEDEKFLSESLSEISHLTNVNNLVREQYQAVQTELKLIITENNELHEKLRLYEANYPDASISLPEAALPEAALPEAALIDEVPDAETAMTETPTAEMTEAEIIESITTGLDPIHNDADYLIEIASTNPVTDTSDELISNEMEHDETAGNVIADTASESIDKNTPRWSIIILVTGLLLLMIFYIIFKTSLLYNLKLKYLQKREKGI